MQEKQNFSLTDTISEEESYRMSPLVLAYIGDAVHSLYVRKNFVINTDYKAHVLHKLSSAHVNATHQAKIANEILDCLGEREHDVYMRARNSKTKTPAKSASLSDYQKASGLEAVIGYLYLYGNLDRITELLELAESKLKISTNNTKD